MLDVVSAPRAVEELAIEQGELFFLMQRLGFLPMMRIDGTDYYYREHVDECRNYIQKKRVENEQRKQVV